MKENADRTVTGENGAEGEGGEGPLAAGSDVCNVTGRVVDRWGVEGFCDNGQDKEIGRTGNGRTHMIWESKLLTARGTCT